MDVLDLKAKLLALSHISLSNDFKKNEFNNFGNLHRNQWVFLKLSNTSRVRLVVKENARLVLCKNEKNEIFIYDKREDKVLAENVLIEKPLAHAPEQMFFTLYRSCFRGCLFCPLTYNNDSSYNTLERIIKRIDNSPSPKSISITTSNPQSMTVDNITSELCYFVENIKEHIGKEIPIGISLNSPSKDNLMDLKSCGVSEMRLNIEVASPKMARKIMPQKPYYNIIRSLENACEVFGKGKVSSNIIIGLGESEEEILKTVDLLAQIGTVATLYPFDPIEGIQTPFKRPNKELLCKLAIEHKKILESYSIDPLNLETMCCACAASHIYPGRDL